MTRRLTCRRWWTRSARHDRFLVVTHENPDGDALGSLLATALALRQLGKDVAMYHAAEHRCRTSTRSCSSTASCASCRTTSPSACSSRSTARRPTASAPTLGCVEHTKLVLDIDHHHDNTRFGDVNLIVADASSTGEVLRDVFAELGVTITPEIAEPLYIALVTDTGRFQYTNTTPKSLRLAAELVEAGADVHAVFQQVYESVEFAKLKLLARALDRAQVLEGGRIVVSHLVRTDFAEVGAVEAYSEGIIDYLRAVEGSELAVLIREPPRDDGPSDASRCGRASTSSTCRRSRAGSAAAATGRPPASRATCRSTRSPRSSAQGSWRNVPPRALEPAGVALVDKPAGPSSFAIVAQIRRVTRARTGHAGTLDPFATGLLARCRGGRRSSRRASSVSTSAT